jgi:hypothetical protein
MQAQNFTKQDMVKGTILHVVNKVRGYPPNRSDVDPRKDIHKQCIFPRSRRPKV